jgi:hypothetical protein
MRTLREQVIDGLGGYGLLCCIIGKPFTGAALLCMGNYIMKEGWRYDRMAEAAANSNATSSPMLNFDMNNQVTVQPSSSQGSNNILQENYVRPPSPREKEKDIIEDGFIIVAESKKMK